MKRYGRLLAVALGPGLVSGVGLVSYIALQSFVLGNCDMKFGCVGGVELAGALAAASFALSALGLILPVVLFRSTVRTMSRKWLAFAILLLAVCLLAMLFTVSRWPFEPLVPLFAAWSAASAVLGLAVLFLARRVAPNSSFNPKPLRGSA